MLSAWLKIHGRKREERFRPLLLPPSVIICVAAPLFSQLLRTNFYHLLVINIILLIIHRSQSNPQTQEEDQSEFKNSLLD